MPLQLIYLDPQRIESEDMTQDVEITIDVHCKKTSFGHYIILLQRRYSIEGGNAT
jgi:hypothetical protein